MMAKSKSSLRFLLDENISHKTSIVFSKKGYSVITAQQADLLAVDDRIIFKFAAKYGYVIVTLDLDFGYLFHQIQKYHSSTILLRLSDQTIESVNQSLRNLLGSDIMKQLTPTHCFITIDDNGFRFRKIE